MKAHSNRMRSDSKKRRSSFLFTPLLLPVVRNV